ncbi:ATP-binding cassette domain-containing protein [Streptomyces sp. SID685]|uniref:ATP-binding cassette domain-containing protein n=1 Tax=Streptomyces sp. SID685 TaxID=2690322 RepID=UPI00136A5497|nr:ATP-binding cassette domain-containing protein [Streptomyces sp. SID685]MYR83662.1 ATP-binding cassette domain-containing protein [Streptomyces sp. SID685]
MTPTSQLAIKATGLRKSYGDKLVLDNIDFEVPAGRIWSLLGPNGAGKTTLVQILSTLIRPDAGTVHVAGHDLTQKPEEVRRAIGVTGQFSAVDELLTGEENLLMMCRFYRLSPAESRQRTDELLEQFELAGDDARKLAGSYSGGMKRKLDLAMTLVGRPRIIFLDEPTTGLDPRSRRTMWAIIRELVADGVTIFLTTQYLEEADELADQIAVLHQGGFVAQGTPSELKQLAPTGHIRLTFDAAEQLALAASVLATSDVDEETLSLRVPNADDLRSMRHVLDRLDEASITPVGMTVHNADLDDVFLTLTSQTATDNGKQEAVR